MGELSGRMGAVENGVREVNDSMKILVGNNALLLEHGRQIVQHDKRLVAIENRCHERKAAIEAIGGHIANDKSVDAWWDGKIATAVKYIVVAGLGVCGTRLAEYLFR